MTGAADGGSLAAEPEPSDDGAVARVVLLDQIGKKATALADELEEAASRMVVLGKAPEMLGQPLDPLGEERDLDLRRAGVTVLGGVPGDDLLLCFPRERHSVLRTRRCLILSFYDRRMVSAGSFTGQMSRCRTAPASDRRDERPAELRADHGRPRNSGIRVERSPERERGRRRAVATQPLQPIDGLIDRRDVPGRNPPQHEMRLGEALEPLGAATQDARVGGGVGERPEALDRLPDGHVQEQQLVVEGVDARRVAGVGLEAPQEPGAPIGERVDRLQVRHEVGDLRSVDRCHHPPDVQLGQVPTPFDHDVSSTLVRPRTSAPSSRTVRSPTVTTIASPPARPRYSPGGGSATGIGNPIRPASSTSPTTAYGRPRSPSASARSPRSIAPRMSDERISRPSMANGGTTTTSNPSRRPRSASVDGVPARSWPNAASGVMTNPARRQRSAIPRTKTS